MRPVFLLPLLVAGCAQGGPSAVPATPVSPASLATSAADTEAARRLIRDHLESEAIGFRVEVASLQLVSPAYEGEHVFVANTITRREATGPALAWGRVVGSAWVSPRRKVVVWKERPRAWPAR
jgi:hypothetical protein